MLGRIYVVHNRLNGKCYVGQTVQTVEARIAYHRSGSNNRGMLLHRAIQKYGQASFDIEIVEECETREELDEAEGRWIEWLNSLAPNGYNIRPGGGCHAPLAPETRAKIGAAQRGCKRSPEVCERISAGLKGRQITWGDRISAANRGRKCSPEHIAKWIAAGRAALAAHPPSRKGDANGHNKLSWDDVREIRRRLAEGATQQSLADEFGVQQAAISKIALRKTWWPDPAK